MKPRPPVTFRDSGPALDDRALDQCEQTLECKLPAEYRAFLLQHNGGKPTPDCYLIGPGRLVIVERLFSMNGSKPDRDLVTERRRLQTDCGLGDGFIPIAKIRAGILLVSCREEDAGGLYDWWNPEEYGFRWRAPDFDSVERLYFGVDELFDKLGPRKDRGDPDALFFEMCAAASSAACADRMRKIVSAGYDVNFVLPGFAHPIFRSLRHDVFSMAALLVELGTRPDHLDEDGVPVVDRIIENLQFWRDRAGDPKAKSVHRMARRRIQLLEAALRVYLP